MLAFPDLPAQLVALLAERADVPQTAALLWEQVNAARRREIPLLDVEHTLTHLRGLGLVVDAENALTQQRVWKLSTAGRLHAGIP